MELAFFITVIIGIMYGQVEDDLKSKDKKYRQHNTQVYKRPKLHCVTYDHKRVCKVVEDRRGL